MRKRYTLINLMHKINGKEGLRMIIWKNHSALIAGTTLRDQNQPEYNNMALHCGGDLSAIVLYLLIKPIPIISQKSVRKMPDVVRSARKMPLWIVMLCIREKLTFY